MLERGLILTGSDAELVGNALSEVKIKAYKESEVQLDDAQELDALVSSFRSLRNASDDGQEERHSYFRPLPKHLVLGTIIDKQVSKRGRSQGLTAFEKRIGIVKPLLTTCSSVCT